MRKIVIHEVNVHIGGPLPAGRGKSKKKGKRKRQDRARAEPRDGFEQEASERTASHVKAGQDDLAPPVVLDYEVSQGDIVPDYAYASSLGSVVAIPTFHSLEDTDDHDVDREHGGEWDDVEDDLGHGSGDVDEHGDVPDGADEFTPGIAGEVAISPDDALAYAEDAPTAEELKAAFANWQEPEFCGLTSYWWRAFGSLMACASAGLVPEDEWVDKAIRYLAGTGEPFGKRWTDAEHKAAREAWERGGEALSQVFCADHDSGDPKSFSLAALAVYGCDEAPDLDALLMEASGTFNSAVIAEHASRLRGKPEIAERFLAAFREALRHDARLVQAAAAWESVQRRVDEIHAQRRELEAAIHASSELTWTQVAPGVVQAGFRAPGEGWDEDTAFLTAFLALGYASRALARGAFLAAGPVGEVESAGRVDPSSSAG